MANSPHFSDHELACRHCDRNEATQALVDALERFRANVSAHRGRDTPVYVDSAYRCQVYDDQVQANNAHKITNSVHVQGIAADVRVKGMTAAELYEIAQASGFTGIGVDPYRQYIHVDVRQAPPARWAYAKDGDWIHWSDDVLKGGTAA
jgi:uncharacterized protein YcbK (DUF882 family)